MLKTVSANIGFSLSPKESQASKIVSDLFIFLSEQHFSPASSAETGPILEKGKKVITFDKRKELASV